MRAEQVFNLLSQFNYKFITGVPDSIFKDLLLYLWQSENFQHIISANEGEACALGVGYHLATGKIPIIYMQNSGLGNAINPLTSLLDSYIYSIPALLLISWRGMPGEHDEPQHQRMGEILCSLLGVLNIPYKIIESDSDSLLDALHTAEKHFINKSSPFALIFKRKSIDSNPTIDISKTKLFTDITREMVIEAITQHVSPDDIIVSTTGKASRDLFEIRELINQSHQQDFLTVGSMGCSSAIALGIALSDAKKRVILLDGDGACLMRMETLATIGHYHPQNFIHILIDNNAHESTGGQPTVADTVNFSHIATACGYATAMNIAFADIPKLFEKSSGPSFYRIKVNIVARENLGRPSSTPLDNKQHFMKFMK